MTADEHDLDPGLTGEKRTGENVHDLARLAAIDAVFALKSDEVRQFVGQYRGSREGSVARFCCDLIDAIEGATA